MVAQLIQFNKDGLLPTEQRMIEKWASVFKAQMGFKGVTFIRDDDIGKYGVLLFWKSEEYATAARKALFQEEEALSCIDLL